MPCTAFCLEQMNDGDLDQVTARFGVAAASEAAPLTAPVSDAGAVVGNVSPAAVPASIAGSAIVNGGYANDRVNDVTTFTNYFVNMNNLRVGVTLGFF